MGVIMEKRLQTYNVIGAILIFFGIPLLLYALGDYPRRSILKETISLLTLLAFSMMLGQFFLARSNNAILKVHKMSSILKIHKFIGYFFIAILLAHPFFVVIPRYFESGAEPKDAFITMITTFDRTGVILGIVAYGTMILTGITSLFREKLPVSHKTWRLFHGILSIGFIGIASWHAINLGRHTNKTYSFYILILAFSGVLLLLNTYFSDSTKKAGGK